MTQIILPFKVGEIVEIKSFEGGYRGAWFRCKIVDITTKSKELFYSMEYIDYPEEAIDTVRVYEKAEDGETHLMVRPKYPPHYHESDLLKINGDDDREVEPLIGVHGSWKVGDLVDWCKDDAFWSGKVLETNENEEAVQVELLPPPLGEGKIYEALCKDLRPSLEWSLQDGWKLPSLNGKKRQCAKLVKRKNEVADVCDTRKEQTEGAKKQKTERAMEILTGNEGFRLNITESGSIDAAAFDLEELIVRIEWLKRLLTPDVGDVSYWEYEDYCP
uniref:Agenet domain-containing protein n=1 Tax=Noccaea caerulescens TaxID=107243 RepID=A0A1J3GH24_NOCCA